MQTARAQRTTEQCFLHVYFKIFSEHYASH